jgi:hypothetical protein
MASLRDRIAATLDPNADHRRQAELELKFVRRPRRRRAHSLTAK